jgi:hypothetical protein
VRRGGDAPPDRAEYKQVRVLFADVVGSMRLVQRPLGWGREAIDRAAVCALKSGLGLPRVVGVRLGRRADGCGGQRLVVNHAVTLGE